MRRLLKIEARDAAGSRVEQGVSETVGEVPADPNLVARIKARAKWRSRSSEPPFSNLPPSRLDPATSLWSDSVFIRPLKSLKSVYTFK